MGSFLRHKVVFSRFAGHPRRKDRSRRPLRLLALLSLSLLLASCAFDYRRVDPRAAAPLGTETVQWEPYRRGIHLASLVLEEPPMRLYFARVALDTPGLRVITTPPNGEAPLDTFGMRTTTFARRSGAVLAINASQFRPVEQEPFAPKDVIGLAVSAGERYSPDEGSQAFVGFRPDGTGMIARDGDEAAGLPARREEAVEAAVPLQTAVAGRPVVLEAGRPREFGPARHPRTGVGLSRDGRTLYILVAEGRMSSRSIGLTLFEVGAWLRHLGAWSGLNLDGGGSTTLVVRDAQGRGEPRRVNRSVHNPIWGSERVVANHLGFLLEGED